MSVWVCEAVPWPRRLAAWLLTVDTRVWSQSSPCWICEPSELELNSLLVFRSYRVCTIPAVLRYAYCMPPTACTLSHWKLRQITRFVLSLFLQECKLDYSVSEQSPDEGVLCVNKLPVSIKVKMYLNKQTASTMFFQRCSDCIQHIRTRLFTALSTEVQGEGVYFYRASGTFAIRLEKPRYPVLQLQCTAELFALWIYTRKCEKLLQFGARLAN